MVRQLSDYKEKARNYREVGAINPDGQVNRPVIELLEGETEAVTREVMACINAETLTNDGTIQNDGVSGAFEVDQLEGNVAGDFNLGSGRKRIDTDILADEGKARRTIIHENRHAIHYQRNTSGKRVANIAWEEALTELGASQEDGGAPMAYQDHITHVRKQIARIEGVTEQELIRDYAAGRAEKINDVIKAAEANGGQSDLALAA